MVSGRESRSSPNASDEGTRPLFLALSLCVMHTSLVDMFPCVPPLSRLSAFSLALVHNSQSHGLVLLRWLFTPAGVQKDLLPLVEGTTISTRYGNVQTNKVPGLYQPLCVSVACVSGVDKYRCVCSCLCAACPRKEPAVGVSTHLVRAVAVGGTSRFCSLHVAPSIPSNRRICSRSCKVDCPFGSS